MKQTMTICFILSLLTAALFSLPGTASAEPTLQYSWNMDTDPGWTTEGIWAFGQPTGGGGDPDGDYPDPTSGHTGSYVYGYNLYGNYENGLPETNLTSSIIDCSGLSQVTLKFRRWLGVEEGYYDHAYIRVSNDGSVWTTVWENPDDVVVTDSSWNPQELDISSIADHQPTVYLRWTMGETDDSLQWCGWNIDDVEIWAESAASPPTSITGSASAVSQTSATLNGTVNPNGASTTVAFNYGLTTSYGSTATASQSPLTGNVSQAVSTGIAGLAQGTTYHYRVAANNSAGTAYGADRTFTTTKAPTAITGSASAVSQTSATLNGTVNPNGASTTVAFNYGRTTSYGSTATASQSPITGNVSQAVSTGIAGLTKGTTYHYRVVAINSAGTAYGADRTFVTGAPCPECSGPIVTLENVTFPSGKVCECTAAISITIGTGVTIETGATVTFQAPTVKLKPGFHAKNGANVRIKHP